MKKLFDTNVILDYPQVIFEENAILSLYVLKELDKLKNDRNSSLAHKARRAVRYISQHIDILSFDETYIPSREVDEALVDIALVNHWTLVTNDINLQVHCQIKKVCWESYTPQSKELTKLWKKDIIFTDEDFANFYSKGHQGIELDENQFVFLRDINGEIKDKYCREHGILKPVSFKIIQSSYMGEIKPRNIEQQCAIHILYSQQAKVKVLTGRFGSGKTFLMLSTAVENLMNGQFDRIVYVRNNIGVRDTLELGSLPGNEIEKIYPYLMPLADKVGGKFMLDQLIEEGRIEPIHLGYLRGRDLKNSLIYCTEAQNLTTDHVKLLLGRVGEGSELWLDGDFKAQVDKKVFQEDNGLRTLIETLSGNPYFAYVNLEKSERSPVAALTDLLDEG